MPNGGFLTLQKYHFHHFFFYNKLSTMFTVPKNLTIINLNIGLDVFSTFLLQPSQDKYAH